MTKKTISQFHHDIMTHLLPSATTGSMTSQIWRAATLSHLLLAIWAAVCNNGPLALSSFIFACFFLGFNVLCYKFAAKSMSLMSLIVLLSALCFLSYIDQFSSPLFILGVSYIFFLKYAFADNKWLARVGFLFIQTVVICLYYLFQANTSEHLTLASGIIVIAGLTLMLTPIPTQQTTTEQKDHKLLDCNLRFKNLIRVACHDLSNPLTLILGSAQLAQSGAFLKTPEKSLLFWEKVEGAAENINQLIASLRAFEAMQEPKRLVIREIYIHSLIADICDSIQDKLEQKDLHLKVNQLINKQLRVMIDPHFFTVNCLKKILNNAIRFSPPGSSIFLESFQKNEQLILKVRDQGPGIDDEIFEKLFHFDFMKKQISQSSEKGHGFGLAVAKLLMLELGGDLSISTHTRKKRQTPSDEISHGTDTIAIHTGTTISLILPLNFVPMDKSRGIDGRPIDSIKRSEFHGF
ncbi:MAG: sensor histidine kinase [Oligoflexus sp.]